ncbi:hypothetical protein [Agarilytica rhodophyticola]|uniref:hypothetical protein n=1 Tax=Agarilytica rhodophyticola TaxID=1737490 RepID=UPI000B3417D6|nr:hypothetical protein [Agarilytica rhodophyticola]
MNIRYIFYGGTRERHADGRIRQIGIAHNSAFQFAGKNLVRDYKNGKIQTVKIITAADLVSKLNKNAPNSITSLDILCHGTPYSLNFSIKENENAGLVTGWFAKQALSAYYSSWDDGVYTFSKDSRYVSEIDFNVFDKSARIQIHGCNTARGSMPGDTLVEALSKELYSAGKKHAYVIGHTDKSNPNIYGTKTTIKQQDYRHGERSIYSNGKLLFQTKKSGVIQHTTIQGKISGR